MTRSTAIRLLLAQTALMILLAWVAVYLGRDEFRLFAGREEDEVATASHAELVSGLPTVRLSGAAQQEVGISCAAVRPAEFAPQTTVAVVALDTQPLLELRDRLQAARIEAQAARIAASASATEQARVRALYEDDRNASQRALQSATAQAQADSARGRGAEAAVEALRAQARISWGDVIAGWLESDTAQIERLVAGKDALLRAGVRPEDAAGTPAALRVVLPGSGKSMIAAPIGPAPRADAEHGGSGLLYRLQNSGVRPGLRLAGSLSRAGAARAGALIPASAVVWHSGKPWVYLREADDRQPDAGEFRRHDVSGGEALGDDWFVAGFEGDAEVVVRGAQVLLSEEQKSQIKNENDD